MSSEDKRNIILVTLESTRADHCSFMGYRRNTTPTLGKMAKEGVCFNNAYSPGPRTPISMVGTFTGELLTEYVDVNNLEENWVKNIRLNLKKKKTLAQSLSEMGYTTGAFNPSTYASSYYGFDKGFQFFEDFLFSEELFEKLVIKGGGLTVFIRNVRDLLMKQGAFKTWESFYHDILEWVKSAKRPFFLWIFLLDTHLPFFTPRKYRKWINWLDMYYYNWKLYKVLFERNVKLPDKVERKIIDAYDTSIYYADRFFESLINDTADYNPLIIVNSDHGEAFGERGVYGHNYPYLYEENTHVPLIIWNGGTSGQVQKPVSMLDLYETVLDLAKGSDLDETALMNNNDKWVLSKGVCWRDGNKFLSVGRGKWKYIDKNNDCELYNLEKDPNELDNLASKYPNLTEEMMKVVEGYVRKEAEKKKIKEGISSLRSY